MAKKQKRKSAAERDLEEGLLETFPGSDAVAVLEPTTRVRIARPTPARPARKRKKPARRKRR